MNRSSNLIFFRFPFIEKLKRLDTSLSETLAEKQKLVCDLIKLPNEHFQAVADIAGQPEAPREPSDLVLAAYAEIETLTKILNSHMNVSVLQEVAAASASLCDECYKNQQKYHSRNLSMSDTSRDSVTTVKNMAVEGDGGRDSLSGDISNNIVDERVDDVLPDDDGYCEIADLR